MELRAGYKQTEIGLIPSDWEVKELGEIGIFKNGINKGIEDFGFGYPFVNLMDVFGKSSISQNESFGLINSNDIERKLYDLKKGDVLFIRSSVKPSGVGLTCVIENNLPNIVFSGFIIRYRDNNYLDEGYKKHCFYDERFRNNLIGSSTVSANTNINQEALKKLKIPLPPTKAEQSAIANALSDADALIDSLEKLIAKKRNIKQGAMQKLLQPKEGWEVKKLGEVVGKITTGKLDANAMKENGEYRFYTCAKDYYLIDEYAFDSEALLVSGNGANVGYIHYYKGKFNAYQRTYVLTDFSIDVFYIKLFLDSYLAKRISIEVSAGNTPYIKMDTITDMVIYYPKTLAEQTTIATILSDIDNEIAALETKLEKYKKLKLGMMQNLLTGKIRLI
jgi:type I restriction enzyme, S subunit